MIKAHPWLISLDCTYKTNQFNMPLLDIVGPTATGKTFFIGFLFVKGKTEATYEDAMSFIAELYSYLQLEPPRTVLTDRELALIKAINKAFPETETILCIWHINMNIRKPADPTIKTLISSSIRLSGSRSRSAGQGSYSWRLSTNATGNGTGFSRNTRHTSPSGLYSHISRRDGLIDMRRSSFM